VDRNRLIAGAAIAVALIILFIYGLIQWRTGQQHAGQRSPLPELAYCSSDDVRPCIVSFSLDSDGKMLVNVLTPGTSFPAFYLKIIYEEGESLYECQKVKKFPENVYCVGEEMQVGQLLQFLMISTSDDVLLAEGSFAIIGLALPTPEDQLTITVPSTQDGPVGTPIPTTTPIRPKSTPSPSPSPSYPNPPYPNPSPSYP
jgi:hypothetical protein